MQDDLLNALATSTGNILDNTALLDSLRMAKSKATEIQASLEGSAKAAEELDRQRNVFRPFAEAGSRLFFCLQPLQSINNMYQYSLGSFLGLFNGALDGSGATKGGKPAGGGAGMRVEDKIASLSGSLETQVSARATREPGHCAPPLPPPPPPPHTHTNAQVLYYVGRSLLKADRLMFALHLVHAMHPELFSDAAAGTISVTPGSGGGDDGSTSAAWRVFMGDVVSGDAPGGGSGGGEALPKDFPLWASRDRVPAFRGLSSAMPDLVRALGLGDNDRWARWARSEAPEREFSSAVTRATTPFQRLLVVQVLRPDRLLSALQVRGGGVTGRESRSSLDFTPRRRTSSRRRCALSPSIRRRSRCTACPRRRRPARPYS